MKPGSRRKIVVLTSSVVFIFSAITVFAIALLPNDSKFDSWAEDNPQGNNWGQEFIKLPSAWALATGSSTYPIAVVDDGFDIDHKDLKDNIKELVFGYLKRSHGTHVAGIIGAKGNNRQGVAGTMWDVGLNLYGAGFFQDGEIYIDSLSSILGMKHAILHNARILNYSAGATFKTLEGVKKDEDFWKELLLEWAQEKNKDVLFVISTGNDFQSFIKTSPASLSKEYNNVISVAAIDQNGNLANFSTWGSNYGEVTVAAPGVDIFSTLPGDTYGNMSGTSMAASFVSGLAGLIWSRAEELGKTLTAAEVKQLIVDGAKKGGKYAQGPDGKKIPIINAYESLKLLEPEPEPPPSSASVAWPAFGHDATRSGQSEYNGPQTNNIKWNNNSITGWWSQAFGIAPVIGKGDVAYIGNEANGKLYAINPDGTVKWIFSDNGNPLGVNLSMPAVGADGIIYIGSNTGRFYAINSDGTQKWKYSLDPVRQIGGSPVVGNDGMVYFNTIYSSISSLYVLNSDGTVKWTFDVKKGSYTRTANPAIGADGTIYASFWEDGLYALNPDGTVKWKNNEMTVGSPLVGTDGTIYVIISRYTEWANILLALNPDGTKKWEYKGVDLWIKPAISKDGIIFAKGRDANDQYVVEFWAIKSNGALKWKNTEIGYVYFSTPAIGADGLVYIATIKGLYALNSADGTIKWKKEGLCCSSPAIASNGLLYYGTYDKGIYGFGD